MPAKPVFRVTASSCPECGALVDACTNATGDSGPEVDDLTICAYCGVICLFKADFSLRIATPTELLEIDRNNPEAFALILRFKEEIQRRKK